MKPLVLLLAAAAFGFALTESRVSLAAVHAVESSVNQAFSPRGLDPWDLVGETRGTYLDGYGILFTFEIDLVNAGSIVLSPFKPSVTPDEIAAIRDRKMKRLPELRDAMRTAMMDASTTLEGLPSREHVTLEATLLSYSWERNGKEMPRRVLMTAAKQQLLDAKASHATPADLAKIVEEQDQ